MKFSGKMWRMIILKAIKNQGFTLSLEDVFLEKLQEGVNLRVNKGSILNIFRPMSFKAMSFCSYCLATALDIDLIHDISNCNQSTRGIPSTNFNFIYVWNLT